MLGLLLPLVARFARLLDIEANWLPVKGLDTDPLGHHKPALWLWLLQFQPNLYILQTSSGWTQRDRRDKRKHQQIEAAHHVLFPRLDDECWAPLRQVNALHSCQPQQAVQQSSLRSWQDLLKLDGDEASDLQQSVRS